MGFKSPNSILIGFVLMVSHLTAYLTGYALHEKPEPFAMAQEKKIIRSFEKNITKDSHEKSSSHQPNLNNKDYAPKVPSNFPTANNLRTAVESMHPDQLNNYLSKYFETGDLEKINDREAFAQRLIDLYSGEEEILEEQPFFPKGKIAISTNKQYPAERLDSFSVNNDVRLYAHLKLDNSASLLSEVFIKWERADDKKILLFEKKLFDSTRYENWVSIAPQGGWRDGEYHVSFYHFNSQMSKIASYTYFLNEVSDSPES